jgi:segregation and condensation protein B
MTDFEISDGCTISAVVESILFASPEPVMAADLAKILNKEVQDLELSIADVESLVEQLMLKHQRCGLSFGIRKIGKAYQFATEERYNQWLRSFNHVNEQRKLTQTAIETLSIVAYKQPVTKPEIDQIRGVDSGYSVKTLLEKNLVEVAGRKAVPGKPLMYRTTNVFLEHFNLQDVSELPRPREIDEILKDKGMEEHRQVLEELAQKMDA